MSPRDMAQKGPARTWVRSITRIPARGGRGFFFGADALRLAVATEPSSPDALGQALGDRRDLLAAGPGPPPEEARPVREAHVGEVEHIIERFDAHARADPDTPSLRAVAEEPCPALQLDEGDMERSLESFRWRVERGERHHLANSRHARRLHGHGMIGAEARGRHDHARATRTTRGGDGLLHHERTSSRVTQLFVARPPMDWASATRAATCRPSAMPRSCQQSSTICEIPVAASGWPRALRPPDGLTGSRPSSAVSPSRVARPALPTGSSPVSSSEMISKGENASWISATSTRSGAKPAMRTGEGSVVRTRAAPPSEMGQQWKRRRGSATRRLSITVSRVTISWKWASGLRDPFAWFFTATCDISFRVRPRLCMAARVMRPASAGMVVP